MTECKPLKIIVKYSLIHHLFTNLISMYTELICKIFKLTIEGSPFKLKANSFIDVFSIVLKH